MSGSQVLSNEAQRNFRSVLDRVEHHGEHVTVMRYKTAAAVIVPISWYESARSVLSADGSGCDQEA